jgi:hypothetical protein
MLADLTPSRIAFPIEQSNFKETFDQIVHQYKGLAKCKSLKSEILQAFREIGNSIMAVRIIEDNLNLQIACDNILVEGIHSSNGSYISQFVAFDEILPNDEPFSITQWTSNIKNLYRSQNKKPLCFRHLLKNVALGLKNISAFKEREQCYEKQSFAKVWTALKFVSCISSVSGEKSIRELFGDGLPIAGSILLYIYKQEPVSHMIDINQDLIDLYESLSTKESTPEIVQFINSAKWFSKLFDESIDMVSNC